MQKERSAGIAKDVSLLKLEKRDNNGYQRSDDMVWRDAGKLESFNDTQTYYYLPMSGFAAIGIAAKYSMKAFSKALEDSGVLADTVYGVRKADLKAVTAKSNWVHLDDFIKDKLSQQGAVNVKGIIKQAFCRASS
jgi:hypothetical protein